MQPNDEKGLGYLAVLSLLGINILIMLGSTIIFRVLKYCSESLISAYGFEFGVVLTVFFIIILNLWIFYRFNFLMNESKKHTVKI